MKNHDTKTLEQEIAALKRGLTEREKAFEELERRFEMFYEEGPFCYQSLDINGCFLNINRKWLDILGYSREEVVGRRFADFFTPENRDNFLTNFPKLKESGHIGGVEFELIGRDGSTRFMNLTGVVAHDTEDRFVQTHCLLLDITDRKLSEEARGQTAANFMEFTEMTHDLIIVSSLDAGIVYANRSAVERLGYEADELRSMNMLELYADESRDEAREILLKPDKIMGNSYQIPLVAKNGSLIELETRVWHGNWSGEKSLFTVSKDVAAERESLHKFYAFFYRNPSLKRLLGYQPAEINGADAFKLVHPNDREKVRQLLESCIENKTGWTNYEFHQIHKDGSIRDFEYSAVPVISPNGDLEGFRGIDRDVTERNRIQSELKRTADLLKVIVENIAIPISLSTGTLQYAGYLNPKWVSLFGYTLDDMPTVSE